MKKTILFIVIALLFQTQLFSQSCLPEGIEFTTQEQIDNFSQNFPDCEIIEGNVFIHGDDISSLNGLLSLKTINGYLGIGEDLVGNPNLNSLEGLNNIVEINGGLIILGNEGLINLTGLSKLTRLQVGLWVGYNNYITSLYGLDSLINITGDIQIYNNYSLFSLNSLSNIEPENIELLLIENNNSLSFCEIPFICDFISDSTNSVAIFNNAVGCKNQNEVTMACSILGIHNTPIKKNVKFYPNPANNEILISPINNQVGSEILIYNQFGQLVYQTSTKTGNIDLTSFHEGIYLIAIVSTETIFKDVLIIRR